MKRILLFSDSHGNRGAVAKIFERIDEFDKIVFAGDGDMDIEDYFYSYPDKIIAVKGNCDFGSVLPEQAEFSIGGINIFVAHGHRYGAKYGCESLLAEAMARGAQAVLYGHTHRPKIDCKYGITLVNAGALSDRNSNLSSFAEIEIIEGNIFAQIVKML